MRVILKISVKTLYINRKFENIPFFLSDYSHIVLLGLVSFITTEMIYCIVLYIIYFFDFYYCRGTLLCFLLNLCMYHTGIEPPIFLARWHVCLSPGFHTFFPIFYHFIVASRYQAWTLLASANWSIIYSSLSYSRWCTHVDFKEIRRFILFQF